MDEQKDVSLELDTEQTNIETEGQKDPSDNLTPDHPRFKDVIAKNHDLERVVETMRTEMDELRQSISSKQDQGENTDEDERALQIIEKRLSSKFATKDDLNSDRQAIQFDRLSEKYSGSNGYPKFVPVDVVAHAKKNGFSNYEKAYRDMHFDTIVSIEAAKKGTVTVPTSEKPAGGERQQESSTISPQDIAQMSDEEYEKNRDQILTALRPKS